MDPCPRFPPDGCDPGDPLCSREATSTATELARGPRYVRVVDIGGLGADPPTASAMPNRVKGPNQEANQARPRGARLDRDRELGRRPL